MPTSTERITCTTSTYYTASDNVYHLDFEVYGGGGGGGGGAVSKGWTPFNDTWTRAGGGGGGTGGKATWSTSVVPSGRYRITVGSGGTNGNSAYAEFNTATAGGGGTGGTSQVEAYGSNGWVVFAMATGGTGGSGGGADHINGTAGGDGGTGGGYLYGTSIIKNGKNGASRSGETGGAGGNNDWGIGDYSNGGRGGDGSGTGNAGASGNAGIVYITVTYATVNITVESDDDNKGTVSGGGTDLWSRTDNAHQIKATPKSHYKFLKWVDVNTGTEYAGENNKTLTIYTNDPNTEYKYKAYFVPIEYEVSFSIPTLNEDTPSPSSISTKTGSVETAVTLDTLTATHYTFDGWYTSATGGFKYTTNSIKPTENTTVYAHFTAKNYRLAYNTDGDVSYTAYKPYPYYYELPSRAKANYGFNGWWTSSSGGTKVGDAGDTYKATSETTTIYAQWIPAKYSMTFYNADGTSVITRYTNVDYLGQKTAPAPTSPTHYHSDSYTFIGWYLPTDAWNSPTPRYTSGQAITCTGDMTFVAKYSYARTLTSPNSSPVWANRTISGYVAPNMVNPALPMTGDIPQKSGYRHTGWSATNTPPSTSGTPPTPSYTATYIPNLLVSETTLYNTWKPAELESIRLVGNATVSEGGASVDFSKSTGCVLSVQPEDWLGTLSWDTENNDYTEGGVTKHYIEVSAKDPVDRFGCFIKGLHETTGAFVTLYAYAHKQIWNPNSQIIESSRAKINALSSIQATFWTRNDNGEEVQYSVNGQDQWFVRYDTTLGEYVWYDPYGTGTVYPTDPTRTDFVFVNWVDEDGLVVDEDNPPRYDARCTATWMQRYAPVEKDTVILQRFNNDGTGIELQIDLGSINKLRESFSFSVQATPTPTMSSDNTFITELSCSESIPIDVIRVNPRVINDQSDNPHNWSNAKWITEIRGLVDRWQSATDGVKLLLIPKNMRYANVNGQDVCYGDNYDMLGYVKKRYDSSGNEIGDLGLLFTGPEYDIGGGETSTDYILVGYNAIISAYSDTYTAGIVGALSVSFTFQLGGMKAQYQEFADGLLLR